MAVIRRGIAWALDILFLSIFFFPATYLYSGDLMTAWKIRRHGRKTLYEDTKNGFNWYVPSRSGL